MMLVEAVVDPSVADHFDLIFNWTLGAVARTAGSVLMLVGLFVLTSSFQPPAQAQNVSPSASGDATVLLPPPNGQPVRNGQLPAPANSLLPPDPGSADEGGTVVVGRTELEQILARLDAAEAEIGVLRQQTGAPAEVAEVPVEEPVDPCAPAKEKEPIAADSAKYLIPLSTDCGDITFKPGLRIQPRYIYTDSNDNNDFLITRFRIKASGDIFDCAWYGLEFKIDNSERLGALQDPAAVVENAWVDFTVVPEMSFLRVGLYDLPFSRDSLTSDSKLLFMDRSLIKDELTRYGFADNTVGLMLHGRPHCGRYEWMVGVFDNIEFEEFSNDPARHSDQLMPAGRFVVNLFDPAEPPQAYADYKASYLGKGHRLALGINGAVLNEAIEDDENSDVFAWGVDAFYNYGRWVAQAEYDWLAQDFFGAVDTDVQPEGWYAQAGYMLTACWELAGRYQVLDPDTNVFQNQLRWTSIGLNYYIWDHNLKIQTEYQFRDGQDDDERDNVVQCQLQLDF